MGLYFSQHVVNCLYVGQLRWEVYKMSSFNQNKNLVAAICEAYQIGQYQHESFLACQGGLLHKVYQFTTTKDKFIIKILNPDIIERKNSQSRYRITEKIARDFAKHIKAVSAILHDGDPLFTVNAKTIMLFPYIEGKTLKQNEIKSNHVRVISHSLSTMHQQMICVNHAPAIDLVTIDVIKKVLDAHQSYITHQDILLELKANAPIINQIITQYRHFESVFKNNLIISHRDLDPKNVLWDKKGYAHIIDWESAGYINQTKDTLVTAIYFSLNEGFEVNIEHLCEFLTVYQENNSSINHLEIEAGLYGLMGDWLTWLNFNLSRMINHLENSEAYLLGLKESANTLKAIPIIIQQFPAIMQAIKNVIRR